MFRDGRQLPSAAPRVKVGDWLVVRGYRTAKSMSTRGRRVAMARGGMGWRTSVRIWLYGCIDV